MCHDMTSKVIPFPPGIAAPKDDLLLTVRRSVVIKVGAREFSVDMTAKVRPLPDACASSVPHAATVYSISAARSCETLRKKRVTPHVLRHTTAMELLQAGVDRSVIALWLGHESVETTQIYLAANLAIKEDALKKTSPLNAPVGRFKPDDQLLSFLRNL